MLRRAGKKEGSFFDSFPFVEQLYMYQISFNNTKNELYMFNLITINLSIINDIVKLENLQDKASEIEKILESMKKG